MNSSIGRSAKEQRTIALVRHDVERAAEKVLAVYGDVVTPLGLFMAELAAICDHAPLYVRLNLEACIATFEARTSPEAAPDTHRPGHADTGVTGG